MNTLLQSGGGLPDSSPGAKRKIEKQELTIDSIRAAIKEELRSERRELKMEIMGEVKEQLGGTNQLLRELQALHSAQAQTIHRMDQVQLQQQAATEAIEKEQKTMHQRLALLEGKFGQLNGGSLGGHQPHHGEEDRRQPALILGGWEEDSLAADTLQQAQATAAQLRLDMDMEQAFVPGIRRGYVIVPLQHKPDEDEEQHRRRVQGALQKVRNANLVLGAKADGTGRKLWMALSQSPERRAKAKLAGKAKRLALEHGADAKKVEAEFATGTVWLHGVKVSSATAASPTNETTKAGGGWVDLTNIATLLGEDAQAVQATWERIRQGL